MNYKGVIIEESLENSAVLQQVHILKTRREKVTSKHQTPWLAQWTLHTVEVPEAEIETVAQLLSQNIDIHHASSWYIDFKNDSLHYIIFKNNIFRVNLNNPYLYNDAKAYGLSLGIPQYQMQFERLKR